MKIFKRIRGLLDYNNKEHTTMANGTVTVRYGVNKIEKEVFAGMDLDSIRLEVEDVLNVPDTAQAHLNNNAASGDTTARAGDIVEFIKTAGEKGGL
jgi:hypothetical protein